jgi:RNA recognition motif-containing protein
LKIYVGNLNFQTSEASLRDLFAQHGEVEDVHIVTDRDTGRSRGFGFVTMTDRGQAIAAIDALNRVEFDGRTLNVNEARPRENRGGGGGGRGRY